MHNDSRKKEDYDVDKVYYFVNVYSSLPREIEFLKVKTIRWTGPNDLYCVTKAAYIGDPKQVKAFREISYNWLSKTYDEAINEIVDSDRMPDEDKIKVTFRR